MNAIDNELKKLEKEYEEEKGMDAYERYEGHTDEFMEWITKKIMDMKCCGNCMKSIHTLYSPSICKLDKQIIISSGVCIEHEFDKLSNEDRL